MSAHVGLGNPENGRDAVRACAGAFDTYANQLRHDLDWYANQRFSLLNVDELLARVTRVADALSAEARFLEQRSRLRDASTIEPVPLLGVAVDGDRGLELRPLSFLDDTIDALTAGALLDREDCLDHSTGPARQVGVTDTGGARRDESR